MKKIQEKGITLIALVVTIVILLILAGITIQTAIGDGGIIDLAKQSKEEQLIASYKDRIGIVGINWSLKRQLDDTVTVDDLWQDMQNAGIIENKDKDVEKMANDRLLAMLPEDLRKCFAPYLCEGHDYDHQIVKAADSLSAYLKCVEERRAGNHEFDAAGEAIRRQLDAITLPEVQDFIREFVPSFSLTLDELNQPGGHQA